MANKVSHELSSILNKDKEPNIEKEHSSTIFILLIILAVILTYSITLFYNEKTSSENNNSNKLKKIIKENIALKEEQSSLNLSLKKVTKELEKSKKTILQLEKKIRENTSEFLQIQEVPQISAKDFTKNDFIKFYNTNKAQTLHCYNFELGNTSIHENCLDKIKEFSQKNKNAFRFQVIPVINNEQISYYKKFNKSNQDLLLSGLAVKRVNEISWYIKKLLGTNTIVTANNYYVKSKKGNNGFILKAYLE